ncbi:MAG: RNA polymerase sigma factor [Actinomycetota bacterium]|nr:RNA polymerase sigma factor [Actinomycetota bacterium]
MTEARASDSPPNDADPISASLPEPQCFAVLFDRHYDAIARYLGRRVGQHLGDELASETFLRAFAHRARYDLSHPDARPWLYGIATNLLRKHARAEARRRHAYARAAQRDRSEDDLDGADGRADAAALGPTVAAALARLQPADRDSLLLLALTDLDYQGIAIATGVPVGTVRSRLHRARRHLSTELEDAPTAITTDRSST